MRLLEKLSFPLGVEYRIACEESDLAVIATLLLTYLQKESNPEDAVIYTALDLVPILEKVSGEDARWFKKSAAKLKKLIKNHPKKSNSLF